MELERGAVLALHRASARLVKARAAAALPSSAETEEGPQAHPSPRLFSSS